MIGVAKNVPGASDIRPVVNAVVDALTSTSPHSRYAVGHGARFVYTTLSYLPACVADFLLRVVSKFPQPQGFFLL